MKKVHQFILGGTLCLTVFLAHGFQLTFTGKSREYEKTLSEIDLVRNRIGNVSQIFVFSARYVNAQTENQYYRQYRAFLIGDRGSVAVRIRATRSKEADLLEVNLL